MSASRATGLGEPGPIGKKALFRPSRDDPSTSQSQKDRRSKRDLAQKELPSNGPKQRGKRVRITTELTGRAMMIIQETQSRYRLQTGRALPLWRAVSQAIEYYGASKQGREG